MHHACHILLTPAVTTNAAQLFWHRNLSPALIYPPGLAEAPSAWHRDLPPTLYSLWRDSDGGLRSQPGGLLSTSVTAREGKTPRAFAADGNAHLSATVPAN